MRLGSKVGTNGIWRLVVAAALLTSLGCGSNLKMQMGVPLEVKRGYAFDSTRFYQRGKQVDRAHVREELGELEETSGPIGRARGYEVAGSIIAGVGGLVLGFGISRAINEQEGAAALMIGGGAGAAVGIGLALAAESNYVEAAEIYNARYSSSSARE